MLVVDKVVEKEVVKEFEDEVDKEEDKEEDKEVVNCDSCDSVRPCPGSAQTEGQMTKLSSGLYTAGKLHTLLATLGCSNAQMHKYTNTQIHNYSVDTANCMRFWTACASQGCAVIFSDTNS